MRCFVAILLLLCVSVPQAARADWMRAESPNFIVYGEGSESRLRERAVALENFDALLRIVTSVSAPPAPNKLEVYIVSGLDDLRRIRPVRRDIAGFYTASPHGIAAFVDSRTGAGENEILFHEYAHHFMMQYAPGAYPAWYVEGFAEYFMTAQFRRRHIDIGRFSPGRVHSIVSRDWLPIERILLGDTTGLDSLQMSYYYAQSWLIVHYFFSTPERQAALRRYIATRRDIDAVAALESATGLTPEALNRELRRYIRGGTIPYRRMAREEAAAPPVAITSLPRSADDLILYEAAMRVGLPQDHAPPLLERVRALAARHGQDEYARRVLAHAEALHGDAAAADRLLDSLLASAPDDAELLYLRGMRHLRAAEEAEEGDQWESEAREARSWFIRAHQADDNHFQTLYRYAQSLRGQPNFVSENTSNVLVLSHQLAPQVAEIRMNAAMMLMNRNEPEAAEVLLRPLAYDPHDSAMAEAARRMIEAARRGDRPGAPASSEPGGGSKEGAAE